jgi:hypothetical protein
MTVHSSNLVFSREGLKHSSKEIPYFIIRLAATRNALVRAQAKRANKIACSTLQAGLLKSSDSSTDI